MALFKGGVRMSAEALQELLDREIEENNRLEVERAGTVIDETTSGMQETVISKALDDDWIIKSQFAVGRYPPTDPDGALEWMNGNHFIVRDGGKVIVITEGVDPELGRKALDRSSVGDIKNLY